MEEVDRGSVPAELNVSQQFSTMEEAEQAVLQFCSRNSHPVKRESAQSAESYNKRLTNPLPADIKIFTIRWACRYYGCRKSRSRKFRSSLRIRRLLSPRNCHFHITVRYDRVVGKFRISSCHLSHNHTLVSSKPESMRGGGEECIQQQAARRSSDDPTSNDDGRHLSSNGQDMARPNSNGLRAAGSKRGTAEVQASFTDTTDNRPKMTISEGWNQESTRTLCDIMFELKEEEQQHHQPGVSGNSDPFSLPEPLFWVKAALKMTDRGYFFSSTFLRERWKQLTNRYQRARSRRSGNGSSHTDGDDQQHHDDNDSSSSTWDLFPTLDAFHQVAKRRRRHTVTSPTSPRQQQMLPFVTCSLLDEAAAEATAATVSSRSEDRSSSDDDDTGYANNAAADSDSPADTSWERRHHSLVIDESAMGSGDEAAPDSPVDSKDWFVSVAQRLASDDVPAPLPPQQPSVPTAGGSGGRGRSGQQVPQPSEDSSAPPAWFSRAMSEMEERIEQRLSRALEKHTNIVQEMHGTLKELLIRCVYTKSRPS